MNSIEALKWAIIGKVWVNGETVSDSDSVTQASFTLPSDMNFAKNKSYRLGNLTMRTDYNLNASEVEGAEMPVSLKAGDTIFLFDNVQRTDKDALYTASVQVPESLANTIIANSKKGREAYRAAHPVAA
jgi:hypothetical protein